MPRQLLADYPTSTERHDEFFAAPGVPRPHTARLFEELARTDALRLEQLFAETERRIRENGVSYNALDERGAAPRPWALDPLPLVIDAAEWAGIAAAVAQRARLLEALLADLYGPQQTIAAGLVPPALVHGHPAFLRPAHGFLPAGGRRLILYAADLVRGPDGGWQVLGDRTQAPAGLGYALENRLVVSRLFPQAYRTLGVAAVAEAFEALREALVSAAPRRRGESPAAALLTPGAWSEFAFEHSYLARILGVPLVEGSDLTVRDGRAWLKTLTGLQPLHALLRRLDDDVCDPLELRADSVLGTPGLLEATRRGELALANAIGSGLVESGAFAAYLPRLCERLLGEALRLPSVASWWCGDPSARAEALGRIEELVFKAAHPGARPVPVFGEDLDAAGRSALAADLREQPQRTVAQLRVALSRAPILDRAHGRRLVARAVGLRVFVVARPDGGQLVVPGGLARTASDLDGRILSSQRGGGSKDVWIGSATAARPRRRAAPLVLQSRAIGAAELVRSGPGLPSRVVELLFWFGRYAERGEDLARLLRTALARLVEDAGDPADPHSEILVAALAAHELLPEEQRFADARTALLEAARDPAQPNGLAACLQQLGRIGFQLRDVVSHDNWRSLIALAQPAASTDAPGEGLSATLEQLDRTIAGFVHLSGFVLDGMTRDHGWRFHLLGRRIERLQFYAATLSKALGATAVDGAPEAPEWLLDVADSGVTYRARYRTRAEWLPLLDLLVRDDANPRAIAFLAASIDDTLRRLEPALGPMPGRALGALRAELEALDPARDLRPAAPRLAALLDDLHDAAAGLSDELGLRFFSHAGTSST